MLNGIVFNPGGLDLDQVAAHLRQTDSVVRCPGTRPLDRAALLELECDILVPAALENQIRADNASGVRARFIVEGANGPVTPAADAILGRRGVPILPDILANSGGVTVSYFEWVQNIENEQWTLDEVNHKLREKMQRATAQ